MGRGSWGFWGPEEMTLFFERGLAGERTGELVVGGEGQGQEE